jgi:hypothetical protein
MENTYTFNIYYDKKWVCDIVAHTKWEAIDKAYYRYLWVDNIDRSKLKAKCLIKQTKQK